MIPQLISREEWQRRFAELSRAYEGKSATLEVLPSNVGPQLVAYDQPFGEIAIEQRGADATITILLGDTFTHTVDAPLRIQIAPFESGGGQIVQIESASDPPCRLYLSESAEHSTGRGEIYGERRRPEAGAERAVGGAAGAGRAEDVRGIGLGGVHTVGGGSLGDRDLSGRGDEASDVELLADVEGLIVGLGSGIGAGGAVPISPGPNRDMGGTGVTGHSIGGDADVVDPGGDAEVIDLGADPIGGTGDETGDDRSDDMVTGDVGAQAERDLSELFGGVRNRRRRPSDGQEREETRDQ